MTPRIEVSTPDGVTFTICGDCYCHACDCSSYVEDPPPPPPDPQEVTVSLNAVLTALEGHKLRPIIEAILSNPEQEVPPNLFLLRSEIVSQV